MKDTAPKSSGIIAVAALFSIVSMGVSFVVFEFSFGQSLVVGAAVATLVAVVLSLGWREPQTGPSQNDRGQYPIPLRLGQRDITTGLCKRHLLTEVKPYCRVAVRTLVDDAWQILTSEVFAADGATPEQIQSAEQAQRITLEHRKNTSLQRSRSGSQSVERAYPQLGILFFNLKS